MNSMESKIKDLIKTGEGIKLEFKEGFNIPSLGKEICAFANESGGKIILGVSDDGKIKGFNLTKCLKNVPTFCGDKEDVASITSLFNSLAIN